jgi:hypothetical protein
MAMTAIGGVLRIPSFDSVLTGSSGVFTWDTSTDVLSWVFKIPATGTIANVHYRVSGVTSPSMTHRIQLRTVSATTGLPSAAGTLYGSSTSITVSAATYSTNTNYTAAVNCTGATAGDVVALVFDLSAFTSGSFTQQQRYGGTIGGGVQNFPYQMTNTAASDVLAALTSNCFALEYSGDTYYPIAGMDAIVSAGSASTTVSNSGVTRRGNRFRPTVDMRAVGVWVGGDLDGDCYLRLRLQSDDSLLATATFDKDLRSTTSAADSYHQFDAGATVSLTAGLDYYITLEGNSATSCGIHSISSVPEAAMFGQLSGGATCYGTSYNASYTDASTQRYAIGLLVDAFDVGGGATTVYTGGVTF